MDLLLRFLRNMSWSLEVAVVAGALTQAAVAAVLVGIEQQQLLEFRSASPMQ